jgi:hypothetical protein
MAQSQNQPSQSPLGFGGAKASMIHDRCINLTPFPVNLPINHTSDASIVEKSIQTASITVEAEI